MLVLACFARVASPFFRCLISVIFLVCIFGHSLGNWRCNMYAGDRLEWIVRGSGEAKLTVDFQRGGILGIVVDIDGDAQPMAAI